MAAGHGGSRPGSGRKSEANRPATVAATRFDDPLAYLLAVATGAEPPDGLRIAAAKAALPFVAAKQRVPVPSPTPRELKRRAAKSADRVEQEEWAAKAAAIRAKHGRK